MILFLTGGTDRDVILVLGLDLGRCTPLRSGPGQKSLAWQRLPGIVYESNKKGRVLHLLLHLLLKSQICDPRIQFLDGIVPQEDAEHERDITPFYFV